MWQPCHSRKRHNGWLYLPFLALSLTAVTLLHMAFAARFLKPLDIGVAQRDTGGAGHACNGLKRLNRLYAAVDTLASAGLPLGSSAGQGSNSRFSRYACRRIT